MSATSEVARLLRDLLAYFILFATFAVAALQTPPIESVTALFLSAWIGAIVGIVLVYQFSRGPDDTWTVWKLVAGGMALDIVCHFFAIHRLAGNVALRLPLTALGNLGMLAAAIGIGLLVVRGMKNPKYLVIAATAGAVADLISVFAGPSKLTLDSDLFPYVAYHWGIIGLGDVLPVIGAGDFIFLALYFAAARRFGLDSLKTLMAMIVAFGSGFLVSVAFTVALPALPFMAVALLAAHRQELLKLLSDTPDSALTLMPDRTPPPV